MSMSQSERTLPQVCVYHKMYFRSERFRMFQPSEGRFFANNSRFACHACWSKHKKEETTVRSPIELIVSRAFTRLNVDFRHQFKLGDFVYDFALPRLKVILEVDGNTYHRFKPSSGITKGTKEHTAKAAGWKVVHVKNGKKLAQRAVEAVIAAVRS